MGQCVTCKQFLPPDFMETIDEAANAQRCHYCIQDKNIIYVGDLAYIKADVVADYKIFLNTLKDSQSLKDKLRDMVVDSAVKKNV